MFTVNHFAKKIQFSRSELQCSMFLFLIIWIPEYFIFFLGFFIFDTFLLHTHSYKYTFLSGASLIL